MHIKHKVLSAAFLLATIFALSLAASAEPELVSCERIWAEARHSAFTDLVRYQNKWFCVFREGRSHAGNIGWLRVLESVDGDTWTSADKIFMRNKDLRDAKLSITPDNELMLTGAAAIKVPVEPNNPEAGTKWEHQSYTWFSKDGRNWSKAHPIGDYNYWLWRTTWHKGTAYTVGYHTQGQDTTRLYASKDGKTHTTLVKSLDNEHRPNEATLVFLQDDTALCLQRCSGPGLLGIAQPPYTDWSWKDLGFKTGGPEIIQVPDGRIVGAYRSYEPTQRTALGWVDHEQGTLTTFLTLPSGGDCSYPGMIWHDGLLWVSYYSSHEGRTSIYLAKVRL